MDAPVVPGAADAWAGDFLLVGLHRCGLRLSGRLGRGDARLGRGAAAAASTAAVSACFVNVCPALLHDELGESLDRGEVERQRRWQVHLELLGHGVPELDAGQAVHAGVHERSVVGHVSVLQADQLGRLVPELRPDEGGVQALEGRDFAPSLRVSCFLFIICRSSTCAQELLQHHLGIVLAGPVAELLAELQALLDRLHGLDHPRARHVDLAREDQREGLRVPLPAALGQADGLGG
mmetsp:Transcript_39292/g.106322  ORF Transcript_39292/g.106322 Transcript_39292/m.106322 type:complete len:236 (+) Transcript_39292:832-1539(+)